MRRCLRYEFRIPIRDAKGVITGGEPVFAVGKGGKETLRRKSLFSEDKLSGKLTTNIPLAKKYLAALETGNLDIVSWPMGYGAMPEDPVGTMDLANRRKAHHQAMWGSADKEDDTRASWSIAPNAIFESHKSNVEKARAAALDWRVKHFGGDVWDEYRKHGVPDSPWAHCPHCFRTGKVDEEQKDGSVQVKGCQPCQGTGMYTAEQYEKEMRDSFQRVHGSVDPALGKPEFWANTDYDTSQEGGDTVQASFDAPIDYAWAIIKNIV